MRATDQVTLSGKDSFKFRNRETQSVVTVLIVHCWVMDDFFLGGGQQMKVCDYNLVAGNFYWPPVERWQ